MNPLLNENRCWCQRACKYLFNRWNVTRHRIQSLNIELVVVRSLPALKLLFSALPDQRISISLDNAQKAKLTMVHTVAERFAFAV